MSPIRWERDSPIQGIYREHTHEKNTSVFWPLFAQTEIFVRKIVVSGD